MGYFPKNLRTTAGTCGDFTDERGAYVGTVSSNGGDELDDEAIAAHIAATWNACAGIDTPKLWPGAMGEMVEALSDYISALDVLRSSATDPLYSTERQPEIRKRRDVAEEKLRAILAKLGKV